jgi:hypothetical protein
LIKSKVNANFTVDYNAKIYTGEKDRDIHGFLKNVILTGEKSVDGEIGLNEIGLVEIGLRFRTKKK